MSRTFFAVGFLVASIAAARSAELTIPGAKGDGQADDSDAIQRAVNGGGSVHFAHGIYRLTRPITIDLAKTGFVALTGDGTARVVMAGAGPAFEFVGTHGGSAAPEQFKPEVWDRQRSPRVDGLEIVGAHAEADGIAARGTMQLTITRVLVREARHAIHLHQRNRNVLISDVHLYHNRGVGVLLDNVNLHQINITGSHISYNAGGGVVSRSGNVRNLHIGNCDIESNMKAGAPPTANVLLDSTGGSIGEVAITGCTIQHTSTAPGSANIRLLSAGQNPATATTRATSTNEGHVTITGNILSDVPINIHLQSVRGVTLTGNTFWAGYEFDLLVEDSSNVVVGPNNFDRNPRYEQSRSKGRGGLLFRRSADCTLTGVHINGVRGHSAAVTLERCARINLNAASILDSDGNGVRLTDTTLSRVTNSLIRDDRAESNPAPAIAVAGGHANVVAGNTLDRAPTITAEGTILRDNDVVKPAARSQ